MCNRVFYTVKSYFMFQYLLKRDTYVRVNSSDDNIYCINSYYDLDLMTSKSVMVMFIYNLPAEFEDIRPQQCLVNIQLSYI